jgi:hypothetical protein
MFDFYFNYYKTGTIVNSGTFWKTGKYGSGKSSNGPDYIADPIDS